MSRHDLTLLDGVRCPNCGGKLADDLIGRGRYTCRKPRCNWSGWLERRSNGDEQRRDTSLTATVYRVDEDGC